MGTGITTVERAIFLVSDLNGDPLAGGGSTLGHVIAAAASTPVDLGARREVDDLGV
jgi:hypothetical protein